MSLEYSVMRTEELVHNETEKRNKQFILANNSIIRVVCNERSGSQRWQNSPYSIENPNSL